MKQFIISLCFLYVSGQYHLHAQQNFVAGEITLSNGDKRQGQIDYREKERNPKSIQFRTSEQAPIENYNAVDIHSFMVNDEVYVSKIVSIDPSPRDNIQQIKNYLETDKQIVDTVFLSLYVSGAANLYFFSDKNHKAHFFIEKDTIMEALVFKQRLNPKDEGQSSIINHHKFKGQLMYYLSDCSTVKDKVARLEYKTGSMIKFFKHYNECVNADYIVYNQESNKTKVKFNAVGGLSMTTLSFSSQQGFADYPFADFGYSFLPAIGIAMDVVLPRNRESWSFFNELMYKSYNLRSQYNITVHENKYRDIDMQFDLSYIKLTTAIKYRQPTKSNKIRPFFYAGISNSLALKTTNSLTQDKVFFSSTNHEEGPAIALFRKYEQGYVFGVGANMRKWSADFRFERGNGMSKYLNLKSSTRNFYVLVTYQLNKL